MQQLQETKTQSTATSSLHVIVNSEAEKTDRIYLAFTVTSITLWKYHGDAAAPAFTLV